MRYAVVTTPLGLLTLASTAEGLSAVSFGAAIPPGGIVDEPANQAAIDQLSQYFQRSRTRFDLPLDFRGTPFQIAVWRALLEIPYGETRTYGEIAKSIATANGGSISVDEYVQHARSWITLNPHVVGSCCGTGPSHVLEMHDELIGGKKAP